MGKDEVEYLLEDINEIPDGQKYCLQPVVVKNVNDTYELIDGQQRLTTLYLIMKYLNAYVDIKFSIEYATRKSEMGISEVRNCLKQLMKLIFLYLLTILMSCLSRIIWYS